MTVADFIKKQSTDFEATIKNFDDAKRHLTILMDYNGNLTGRNAMLKEFSTGKQDHKMVLGNSVVLFHAVSEIVLEPGISVLRVKEDLTDEPSIDTKLFIMVVFPDEDEKASSRFLDRLTRLFQNEEFENKLIDTVCFEQFKKLVEDEERRLFHEVKIPDDGSSRILILTASPLGTTYCLNAATSLHNMAKDFGIPTKIEMQDQSEPINSFSVEDIEKAKCIVIASDIPVDKTRFEGKQILQVSITEAIEKAATVITNAVSGTADTKKNLTS